MGDLVAAVDAAAHAAAAYRHEDKRGSALGCSARADALAAQCGGSSTPALRQASEPGAEVDAEAAAAKAAGINFIHLPFNTAKPDPAVVDTFLKSVTDRKNDPAFIHCASGNRAAAMWMIKRMQIDKWDADRAGTEAALLGLTNPALKMFALDYAQNHKQ